MSLREPLHVWDLVVNHMNLTLSCFSSSLSFKCALRESGCRNGYEPTKNEYGSLLAVDVQGNQRGGVCIVPMNLNESRLLMEWNLAPS